jgi:hypothetical protein
MAISTQMAEPGRPEPTTAAGKPAPTVEHPSRWRSVAAVVCVVLAGLLTTPAAVAYWGQRTLNDTQRYVDTVEPLVASPEVQDVIATKVTDAIQSQVDIETILTNVFAGVITDRPRLEQLVGPLSAAINGLIDRQVRTFVASDEFADLWVRANTRAQEALHRVLKGEGSAAVSLQGEQIVLDVDEVIDQVKQRLVARGLTIVEKAPIPEADRQIVLMEAPQVKQMRTIYAFANPLAQWLLPVVALLFLAAFVLARRHPRMTVWIGAIVAANALVVALALSTGRQLFIDQLAGTAFATASRVFFNTLLVYLQRGEQVFFWLGLVLIVAGWFAGRNKYGTGLRTAVSHGLEGAGSGLADGPVGGTGRWVAAKVTWLRPTVVALGVVVLLWGNAVTVSRFWWSIVLVLAVLALLQVLVGAGREGRTVSRTPAPEALPGAAG